MAIGNALVPVLSDLLKTIQPVVERVVAWVEQNPQLTKTIIEVSAGLAGLAIVLGTGGLLLLQATYAVQALGSAFSFLAANPIVLLVAGLALIVTWLKNEIAQLYGVEVTWKDVWNEIKGWFSAVVDWLSDQFLTISHGLQGIFDFASKVIDLFTRLPSIAANAINSVTKSLASGPSFGIGGNTLLPHFASGGIVTQPTVGLIGEAGPEAIIPLNKANSLGSVQITITGNTFMGDREAAEKIGDQIISALKMGWKLA